MAVIIAQVYRYPVKGLSAEPLDRVTLAIGRCLPQDRRYAIALGSTHFDQAATMVSKNQLHHADAR